MTAPAMILMRPSALLWGLAGAAIVLLYLRAIRPPHAAVATGHLWLRILGPPRTSAGSWRRRRLISAVSHLAVLGLVVFAAADPCWIRPRTVVLVIDNSRSMAAASGRSDRLAEAKRAAGATIATLGDRERGAVISAAGAPVLICGRQSERERLAAAVNRLTVVDQPPDIGEAIRLAASQAAPGTELEIHVFSDGCFTNVENASPGPPVVAHALGSAAGNAGVSGLAVRQAPGQGSSYAVLVETVNRSHAPVRATLRLLAGGQVVFETTLDMPSDGAERVIPEIELKPPGSLVAQLECDDALPGDNRLEVMLPAGEARDGRAGTTPGTAPPAEIGIAEQDVGDIRSPAGWIGPPVEMQARRAGPLWPWAVSMAMLLMVVEWALYHRRWTC